MSTSTPFTCLYTGPADECRNCGGWARAAGGPFPGDSRFCSEDCYADCQERVRQHDLKMACCPECGFDRQEHNEGCTRQDPPSALERNFGGTGRRPLIVCLCGSTRFYDAFQQANYERTMAGEIVLSVGFYPHAGAEHGHGEGVGHDSGEKIALDELHKRKIDLCDYVLVLNAGGYIGESTRSEIEYAEKTGRPVRYLEPLP